MKTGWKIFWISFAVIAIGILVYGIVAKGWFGLVKNGGAVGGALGGALSNGANTNTGNSTVYNPPSNTANNPNCAPEFPLQFGSSNDYVGELQKWLKNADYNCLPAGIDGVWGNDMEACVQRTLGTGIVGCQLYKSLGLS